MDISGFVMRAIVVVICCFCFLDAFSQKKNRIKPGAEAPNIQVQDIYGRTVLLKDFAQSKRVLVSFLRYATCPVCNYRLRELKNQYAALQLSNIEVIVFIESSQKNIIDNLMGEKMPFYIVADPKNEYYRKYRVEKSATISLQNYIANSKTRELIKKGEVYVNKKVPRDGDLRRLEAEFLIGSPLVVLQAHYGNYIGDFLEVSSIKSYTVKD